MHCSRAIDADIGARLDQGALELGKIAQDGEHQPAVGRWVVPAQQSCRLLNDAPTAQTDAGSVGITLKNGERAGRLTRRIMHGIDGIMGCRPVFVRLSKQCSKVCEHRRMIDCLVVHVGIDRRVLTEVWGEHELIVRL
jgi:hypothetical protein